MLGVLLDSDLKGSPRLLTYCVARATLWFCPGFFFLFFFFSYAADLSLFLETGKGLTCAVFTESVDLRPD